MKKILVLMICCCCIGYVGAQDKKGVVPKNNEVAMKAGRTMVKKDGQWMKMEEDMMMKDGTKVTKDGTIMMKNGTTRKLLEGEYLSADGKVKKEKVKADKTSEEKMKKGID